ATRRSASGSRARRSQLPSRPMLRASPMDFVPKRPLPAIGLEPARRPILPGVEFFLLWTDRKSLKSPESDEGIQDNPSRLSWSGLAQTWFGLEEFGLRRSVKLRRPVARLSHQMAKPVARDGRSPGDGKLRRIWCA